MVSLPIQTLLLHEQALGQNHCPLLSHNGTHNFEVPRGSVACSPSRGRLTTQLQRLRSDSEKLFFKIFVLVVLQITNESGTGTDSSQNKIYFKT